MTTFHHEFKHKQSNDTVYTLSIKPKDRYEAARIELTDDDPYEGIYMKMTADEAVVLGNRLISASLELKAACKKKSKKS